MRAESRLLDLHAAASSLGEHPFEVVRLLVASGRPVAPALSPEVVEQLRSFGGIERWWDDPQLPADANRARAVVRGVIDRMLQRDRVGDRVTRRENLYRGLEAGDAEIAMLAVGTLLELGALVEVRTAAGALVSIHPEWADGARALVARGQAPAELTTIWEG
jgi:hypothetical protein